MNSKKSWYSYITYLFFTAASAVALTEYCLLLWSGSFITNGDNVFTRWIVSSQTIYNVMMKVFIFAVFLVLFLLFFLITINVRRFGKKHPAGTKTRHRSEIVLLAVIIAGAAAYKIFYYGSNMPVTLTDMSYYDWAQVRTQSSIPEIQHGASMLYLYLLSFSMSFLGNKLMTVVVLQTVIQLITLPVLYFAVKVWAGRVPAFVTTVVFSFFSIINEKLYEANPECLTFLIFCITLLLCGCFCRSKKIRPCFSKILISVLLGLAVGFVCYLDMIGFLLFAFLLKLFMNSGEVKKERWYKILYFLIILVSALLAVVGSIMIKSLIFGEPFADDYGQWVVFAKQAFSFKQYMYSADNKDISLVECFVLTFFATEYIPSFWLHDTDHESVFILLIAVAWTPMMGIGLLSSNILSVFTWSVMAGLGLQCMTVHAHGAQKIKAGGKTPGRKIVIGNEHRKESVRPAVSTMDTRNTDTDRMAEKSHNETQYNEKSHNEMIHSEISRNEMPYKDTVKKTAESESDKNRLIENKTNENKSNANKPNENKPNENKPNEDKPDENRKASIKDMDPYVKSDKDSGLSHEMTSSELVDNLWNEISAGMTFFDKSGSEVKADTARADIAKADTVKADTVKADTVKADTVKADTAKADTVKADMVKADMVKADMPPVSTVKYIKNPLPQPIKHEKKQLSFDNDDEDHDDFDFDHDIKDNDDFDN